MAEHWAPAALDIDPFDRPIRYTLPLRGILGQFFSGYDEVVLGRHSVAVRRTISGIPVSFKCYPLNHFQGVAIHIALHDGPEGDHQVSIRLHHDNKRLCLPLYISFNLDASGARWQAWSRMLRLPMLAPMPDGSWAEPFERSDRVIINIPIPRNPRLFLASRRPRIMNFRTVGHSEGLSVIQESEIIARS